VKTQPSPFPSVNSGPKGPPHLRNSFFPVQNHPTPRYAPIASAWLEWKSLLSGRQAAARKRKKAITTIFSKKISNRSSPRRGSTPHRCGNTGKLEATLAGGPLPPSFCKLSLFRASLLAPGTEDPKERQPLHSLAKRRLPEIFSQWTGPLARQQRPFKTSFL